MKDKIYVRNVFGDIYKVDDLTDVIYKTDVLYNWIVKQFNNIIDLIDVGDILKIKISEEWVEKQDTIKFVVVGQTYTITEIKECLENGLFKIIQILTKESYMANCYKVGGE